ncbi:MAG: hypothetical protein GX763_07325 [Clostridiaceae bacterium]|nr:hypothetical protein [Clostridiaceae bacterium]
MIMEKAEVFLSTTVATLDDRPYPGDLSDLYLPDLILQINEDGSGTAILGGDNINLQYVDELFIISESTHTNTDINFIFSMGEAKWKDGEIVIRMSIGITFWKPNFKFSDIIHEGLSLDPNIHYDHIHVSYSWEGRMD